MDAIEATDRLHVWVSQRESSLAENPSFEERSQQDVVESVKSILAELARLRELAAYLDNPEVLLRIPQPHRIKLSQLLHGAERFCEDCGEPLGPDDSLRKCQMCEEDERKQHRST